MFTKMQNVRILAFVITALLLMLFADANGGSGELHATTNGSSSSDNSGATTATTSAARTSAARSTATSADMAATTNAATTTTVTTAAGAAGATMSTATTTAPVTLASSNAPATLTNDATTLLPLEVTATDAPTAAAAAVTGSETSTMRAKPPETITKVGESAETTAIEAAAAPTFSATMAMRMRSTPTSSETITATADFGSKSTERAAAAVVAKIETETKDGAVKETGASLQVDGNEAKAQIKNANAYGNGNGNGNAKQLVRPSKRLVVLQTNMDDVATPAAQEQQQKWLSSTNVEHDAAATLATVNAWPESGAIAAAANMQQTVTTAATTSTIKDTPASPPTVNAFTARTMLGDGVYVERRLENGLYRIKLAEIVTDEFNGLQQPPATTAAAATTTNSIKQEHYELQQKATLLDTSSSTTTQATTQANAAQIPLQQQHTAANDNSNANNDNHKSITDVNDNNKYNNTSAGDSENESENVNGNDNDGAQHKPQPNVAHTETASAASVAAAVVATPGKLNIVDLYPMKMEDFNPIIRDSNAKLLKERTIFKPIDAADAAEHRQNLLPNEVDDDATGIDVTYTQRQPASSVNRRTASATARAAPDSISDFTGQVLAEQDGVITEIEQKFRLNEFAATVSGTNKITTARPTSTASKHTSTPPTALRATKSSYSVNHKIQLPTGHDFIDRRVKKSFDFPMHRAASDAMSVPHVDFANTKFNNAPNNNNNNNNDNHSNTNANNNDGSKSSTAAVALTGGNTQHHTVGTHPEFSTTKFYNSKELYNEMMQHSRQKMKVKAAELAAATKAMKATPNVASRVGGDATEFSAASRFAVPPSSKLRVTKPSTHDFIDGPTKRIVASSASAATATATVAMNSGRWRTTSFSTSPNATPGMRTATTTSRGVMQPVSYHATSTTAPATATSTLTTTTTTTAATVNARKYQNELKRAKLLLKTILLPGSKTITPTTTTTTAASNANTQTTPVIVTKQPPVVVAAPASTAPTDKTLNVIAATSNFVTPSSSVAATRTSVSGTAAGVVARAPTGTNTDVDTTTSATTTTSTTTTYSNPPAKFAAIRKIASSSKTMAAAVAAAAATSTGTRPTSARATTTETITSTTTTAAASTTDDLLQQQQQHHTTNPTKSTLKPIVRPRIISRLQEKINSLECEIQNVPQDSHLWRGNETHELLLPIMTAENCPNGGIDCAPPLISWEGEAEIQSGDILIVEINDALLNLNDHNETNSAHNTQVYQVTRSGHEHCDVTEGILLDITPLVVDGRKLVTLYDKDLTEGVNLLIVVSELWGTQCVRLKVTTKTDNCGENADCSGKGVCYSNGAMEDYECQCCSGFAGPHCEEIDACTPSPCTNNGICVDLSQGHEGNSYQCLCPYGYTGKNCQYESDPCNSAECMNGGSCVGNSTHFRCDCTAGYTGPLCQHSLNECESSPCVHGICVDQEDGFRCFCQPGFAGELCNFEYNECESNPCQNDGECIDHIGSFECRCTKGYTGARCQIKVDFCANKPCPDGHRCIDHGNDFSCECPGGHNGLDCNQMPRTQCDVNPCTHGGTCWTSGDSFYCACRPGYTGTMCEDEFVVETVVSSSEFMVDDTSARNFNDKTFGSSVVLKSPIELHNAYFAAGVLAAAVFIVAVVVAICHCKVNQTYRKFSTRTSTFFPILGFGRRHKSQNKLNKHWLSGKGLGGGSGGSSLRSAGSTTSLTRGHLPSAHHQQQHHTQSQSQQQQQQQQHQGGQLHERPFQRHLAMNLENDMYYTVDFSENSQHSPLIQ